MPNLLLFMTPGIGFNDWKNVGSLNRELLPYIEYVKNGWQVKFLTFDRDRIPPLPQGIEAVRFPHRHLLWFLPWIHSRLGQWADIIKTNQSGNAFFYSRAALAWKKPLLLRCGYVKGEYLETTRGLTPKVRLYQWLEAKAFREAGHCQVPTERLSEWVQKRYKVSREKITVIPNFVDVDLFRKIERTPPKRKSVISIGRLARVKRYDLLIKACADISECILTIVGEGAEREALRNLAEKLGVALSLPGNLPNEKLPDSLQKHQLFVTASMWEGHPKALIEAMACGKAVIGTAVKGTQDVITNNVNGLLCESNATSIKQAIKKLVDDDNLRNQLGEAARNFVVRNYDLQSVIEKELALNNSIKAVS